MLLCGTLLVTGLLTTGLIIGPFKGTSSPATKVETSTDTSQEAPLPRSESNSTDSEEQPAAQKVEDTLEKISEDENGVG